MKLTFATTSETGNRPSNQDHTTSFVGELCAGFVVCDGVAGTLGGERAAEIVSQHLQQQLQQDAPLRANLSVSWVDEANQLIMQEQGQHAHHKQMSTTLAALFIDRQASLAWWAHAGDSRIYHFRRGQVEQVTRDHSLVQQMQDAGFENTGINSNLLYNALGADAGQGASFSEVTPLEDGDVFLICSDGFWSQITQREMEQALRMVTTPAEWLALMMQAVSQQDMKDNLSAVAVWMGSPQETTLLQSMADSARLLPPRH